MSDKRKIKIVQVIADAGLGGGPKNVLGILSHLDKSKFEVYLICPGGYLAKEARQIPGVTVYTLRFQSKTNPADYILFRRIMRKIQVNNDPFGPLVIHSHGPRAGLVARLFRFPGSISIYTEHIYDANYHLKNGINERVQKYLLRRLGQQTDLLIAVSSSVRDFLVEEEFALSERVVVVPNGIDAADLRAIKHNDHRPPIIGTIGALNLQKGHHYLLMAIPELLKKYPLLTLEIIGDGEEKENLKRLARQLDIEKHVAFIGKTSNIEKYLKHWNVFALPSQSETFGIVILEAMAAGVPVVASKVGGIPDIIEQQQNGFLVPPANSESLAKAILYLLEHPTLAEKLAKQGRERVKDFEWSTVIKQVEEIYIQLTSSNFREL